MKNKFIKILCFLVLGVSLVQCSNKSLNQQNNTQIVTPSTTNNSASTGTLIDASEVSSSKYQSIVPIISKSNDIFNGTGVIIGPNTLLTNRHVTEGETKDTLYVSLNKGTETINFDIENIITFIQENYDYNQTNVDLSIIQVKPKDGKNLYDGLETFKLATLDEIKKVENKTQIEFAGYPGESQPKLSYDKGQIDLIESNLIWFNSSVKPGQSGSPILNSNNEIIGLCNAGSEKDGVGFLFTQVVLDFINNNIK